MRVVVTGAAGFIGSHVAEAVATTGHEVLAVDTPRRSARTAPNWSLLGQHPGITRAEVDLVADDLAALTDGADAVAHLAGRPGVRDSWSNDATWRDNVDATRRLLEAVPAQSRVVVASSSSVYGSATRPCTEDDDLRPESPYGHAKAEVEKLARVAETQTVILRFFSVYGPRQRPDMAFHRFIEAALNGDPVPVYGDGSQSRAFTYVDDVVDATVRALTADLPPGVAINVGHPETVRVDEAVSRIGALLGGAEPTVTHTGAAPGDVTRTWASAHRAARLLGWAARTGLDEGLARQIEWHRQERS